jgi:putative ATP-dependent endonuclease of the OLD family
MQIRRIKIERFRGIKALTWCPRPGINCLVGPGDVGKSTILDGITLALSSAPGRVASEHDYFAGAVEHGFKIDVLLGKLDDDVLSAWPAAPLWSWAAKAEKAQADPDESGEAVLCVRVRGTEDLEIEHLIIDPSEGEMPLSPSKRQKFGLSAMGFAGTAYRELRLSRGSLLSRNIESDQLRGLVTAAVQASRNGFEPPDTVSERLDQLSSALREVAPGVGDLDLALMSPRGQNLLSMVGLFEGGGHGAVPLANAGLGTQQLALFAFARFLISGSPMFVADEIESGLEPFRQRDLISRIRKAIGNDGQAFLTTHSPAVIGESALDELHRATVTPRGPRVVPLPRPLEKIRRKDPEALICRVPVVVEGQTEMGLLHSLFSAHAATAGTTLGALGVRLVDGGGQPKVFKVTEALSQAEQHFGAFLDNESNCRGKRQQLHDATNVAFGTYSDAYCLEEALTSQLPLDVIDELLGTPGANGRDNATARYQQLNNFMDVQSRRTVVQLAADIGEDKCRQVACQAANTYSWFKTQADGEIVGDFMLRRAPQASLLVDIETFWRAVLTLVVASQ